MPSRLRLVFAVLTAVVAGTHGAAAAQEHVTLRSDVLLYGDNTEFRNPFRDGETISGAAVRAAADVETGPRAVLTFGGFFNQRFGSEHAAEQARPIIALTIRGRQSAFTFGTLPAKGVNTPVGPDRAGPHGLLPPLQRETLAFDRPYEAGLEWTLAAPALRHDMWLNWQRLNTPAHRERFDAGVAAEWRAPRLVSLPFQLHVVHEGGQLYASGPVRDSWGAAAGVSVHGRAGPIDRASLETYGLVSRYVVDRSRPELSRDGVGFFARAAAEYRALRAHVIVWRGRNFIKDEGDPNYLSIFPDGRRYHGTRDYAEAGLTRRFRLSSSALFDVSGRFHRVENHYDYSYRLTSVIAFDWRLR
jgi:hypothetical protein